MGEKLALMGTIKLAQAKEALERGDELTATIATFELNNLSRKIDKQGIWARITPTIPPAGRYGK